MDQRLIEDVKFSNRLFYEIQKMRIALGNRLEQKKKGGLVSSRLSSMFEDVKKLESTAGKVSGELVDYTGLWDGFLKDVKGIGPTLASSLIAEIGDIGKFSTVSKLWAYFGLTSQYVLMKCEKGHKLIASSVKTTCPVRVDFEGDCCGAALDLEESVTGKSPKRKAGYHFLFNSRGRTLCAEKIPDQFIKARTPYYRDVYDAEKTKQVNQGIKLGHAERRARRKIGKLFISHLWEAWREIEGLETRKPYAINNLGHTGYLGLAELRQLLREGKMEVKKAG